MRPQADASSAHFGEFELAEYHYGSLDVAAEKQVRLHLDVCAACSELVNSAALTLPVNPASMTEPDSVLQGPALPEQLRQALEARAVASPNEGQLWRLRGPGEAREVAVLGAIVRREEDHVLVVPVTPDAQEATDLWAAQLPIANTDLVMAFWTSLATPVGYEVLDVWLGWTDVKPLKDLIAAQRRGEEPPRDVPLGRQLDAELAAYRADIGAEFLQLQEARLVPDTIESSDPAGESTPLAAVGDIVTVLNKAGWAPSKLKAVAGDLTSGQAGDVLAGRLNLTDVQLARVSAELGEDLSPAPVSVEWRWVVAVGYPTRRHRYERLASLAEQNPWTFRAGLAANPHAVAARKSQGTSADWDSLAEQQLVAMERAAELR